MYLRLAFPACLRHVPRGYAAYLGDILATLACLSGIAGVLMLVRVCCAHTEGRRIAELSHMASPIVVAMVAQAYQISRVQPTSEIALSAVLDMVDGLARPAALLAVLV
jgi:hypothetical protein